MRNRILWVVLFSIVAVTLIGTGYNFGHASGYRSGLTEAGNICLQEIERHYATIEQDLIGTLTDVVYDGRCEIRLVRFRDGSSSWQAINCTTEAK